MSRTSSFKVGDRVRRAGIGVDMIPSQRALRGTIEEVELRDGCVDGYRVRWDNEPDWLDHAFVNAFDPETVPILVAQRGDVFCYADTAWNDKWMWWATDAEGNQLHEANAYGYFDSQEEVAAAAGRFADFGIVVSKDADTFTAEVSDTGVYVADYDSSFLRSSRRHVLVMTLGRIATAAGCAAIDDCVEHAFETSLHDVECPPDGASEEEVERYEQDTEYTRESRSGYQRETGRSFPPVYRYKLSIEMEPLSEDEAKEYWESRQFRRKR